MNFSQLHERLRMELLRRIDMQLLTAASLARQTGLTQSHISNFLRSKRHLGLSALDRVLAALALSVQDLAAPTEQVPTPSPASADTVPLVSHQVAMLRPAIPRTLASETIQLPPGTLTDLRPAQGGLIRRDWQRFVAVALTAIQARPMDPVLTANTIAVLDRHYTALVSYEEARLNIYAVRVKDRLVFRYVAYDLNRLILRPHSLEFPVELIEMEAHVSPSELIVGRVCAAIVRL